MTLKELQQQKKQKGFTIIEVVLVLAIAGLIFLIVFLALPQLQQSRRDTQRRNDAGRILSALESYASSNDGAYPTSHTAAGTAVSTYAGELKDPSSGNDYVFVNTSPNAGQVQYVSGATCQDGAPDTDGASARDVAILMALENGTYCRDNR